MTNLQRRDKIFELENERRLIVRQMDRMVMFADEDPKILHDNYDRLKERRKQISNELANLLREK